MKSCYVGKISLLAFKGVARPIVQQAHKKDEEIKYNSWFSQEEEAGRKYYEYQSESL